MKLPMLLLPPARPPLPLPNSPSDYSLLTASAHPDSFCSGIQPAVRVAQCLSLLPAQILPAAVPRFRWRSFRVAYAVAAMVAVLNRMVIGSLQQEGYVSLLGDVAAHVVAIFIAGLYFRLARRWRSFSLTFLRVERKCGGGGGGAVADAHPPGLGRQMKRITLFIFCLALAEHSFDRISLFTSAMVVYKYPSVRALFDDTIFQRTFLEAFVTLFCHMTASLMAFIYIFNDLFIMLVSLYASKRVQNLNSHLRPALTKDKDQAFWENARRSYDELTRLIKDIDAFINMNILVSFVQNLFFICFQLLYFLRISQEGVLRSLFRIFSFGYVLARTYVVSYCAASINDHSKIARTLLFSVSSRSYCKEVHRFLQQAINEEMALTGCNFFRMTRAFILTVAGTIATYEIILLQMNKN